MVSLLAAVGLIVIKAAAGVASGSLALLSEAAHSGLDSMATLATLLAVRIASRPPDADHPYGHGKAENVSALIQMFFLLVVSGFIAKEAVEHLIGEPAEVTASWYTFAVVGISIVVDLTRSRALRKAGRRYRSPALEADALHFTADLLTSSVVLIGLILVRAGVPEADAAGGLLVAGYVAVASARLGKRSVDALMDRAPEGSLERIERAAAGVEGVAEVRRVRARYAGGRPHTDVVIAIARTVPLERAHEVSEEVERAVEKVEGGADVVVHVEPLANEKEITDRVTALAAREPRVRQIHNISVTLHPEGLHVALHAKFPGGMNLAEAHEIAEALEASIAREIPGVARVDTHMEPLEHPGTAADITGRRGEITSSVQRFAESLPEVADCHEIIISEVGEGSLAILIHCEAAPGLSVAKVHDASTRIEDEVHRTWPEVDRVTVHFEPARIG